MLDLVAVLIWNTEGFQCLVLRRSGKGKIAGIGKQLSALHHGIDFILVVCFFIGGKAGECKVHLCRVASALTGMGFINDDGKLMVFMFSTDLRYNERELFNRSDDDTLARCDGLAQFTGVFSPCNSV